MLTIRAMTGGEGYAQRHLQQSDYYDQNRTVEGKWHGRGAELLGLKGEVTSGDFEAVRRRIHDAAVCELKLARKHLSAYDPDKGHRVDLMTGVNRQAGQQNGEQHSSVPPTHRNRKGLPMSAWNLTSVAPVLVSGFEVSRRATPAHSPHGGEMGRA